MLLKDTILALCTRDDIDVRQVIYLPADGMRSRDLNRVAVLSRELTRSVGPRPRVWLLDEVSGVPGWTSTLKFLRDNTEMATDTVVCTGSSWNSDAALERDLLAGRAGTDLCPAHSAATADAVPRRAGRGRTRCAVAGTGPTVGPPEQSRPGSECEHRVRALRR
ncbi:MAG: AAA family ATPase [Pseudonocardiaceae bacterium]